MNEFVERSPGGKLFHSCEHPPFMDHSLSYSFIILRCITTLRLLAGVRDGEHIDLSGREGVYQWRYQKCTTGPVYEVH